MAFSDRFESLKGFAANASQSAAKRSRKLATMAKANIAIQQEEVKVKKAQYELGKVFYKNFISGEDADMSEYLPLCEKITTSLNIIEGLKAEIEQAKAGDEAAVEEAPAEEAPAEEAAEAAPAEPVIPEIVVVEDETPEAPEAPEAPEE